MKRILPRAKRNAVAVGQAAGHVAALGQRIAGMAAVAVDVHLDVRDPSAQQRREVFDRPDRVAAVARRRRTR